MRTLALIAALTLLAGCGHPTAPTAPRTKATGTVGARVYLPCPEPTCPFRGQTKKCEHSFHPW